MLESEAETKLCPYKLPRPHPSNYKCVGRNCMAWETAQDKRLGYCGMIPPTRIGVGNHHI